VISLIIIQLSNIADFVRVSYGYIHGST